MLSEDDQREKYVGFAGKVIKLVGKCFNLKPSRMKQDWGNMNGSGTTTG